MKKLYLALILVFFLASCEEITEDPDLGKDPIVTETDIEAPVLVLNGDSNIIIEFGETWSEPGVTCSDNVDTGCTIIIDGDTIDTEAIGEYIVTYNATDSAGNAATELTRTIVVQDEEAPVITLNGNKTVYVEYKGTYSEAGATCIDNRDENCTVVVGGDTVDSSTLGTYEITYNAADSEGNVSAEITRTVIVRDRTVPLFGSVPQTQTILHGTDIDLLGLGLTATDNYDGDLTASITVDVSNTFELSVGNNTATYTVEDSSGNSSTVIISVVVEEKVYGLGDVLSFDGLEIYFVSTEVQPVENPYADYEEAVLFGVEIKNLTNEVHELESWYYDGFGPDGIEVDSSTYYFDTSIGSQGDMLPNAVMLGHLVFEYTGDGIYTLEFSEWFEDAISVKLDVTKGVLNEATNTSGFEPYVPSIEFSSATAHLGETIDFAGLEIFIKGTKVEEIDNSFSDYDKAILVEVEIKNVSDEANGLIQYITDGFGPNGLELDGVGHYFDTYIDDQGRMLPNGVMTGHLVFEYVGDGVYTIELDDFDEELYVEVYVEELNPITTTATSGFSPYTPNLTFEAGYTALNQMFVFDGFEITVKSATVEVIDNMFSDYEKAVLIEVTVKNIGDESAHINMFSYYGFGPDGLKVNSANYYFDTSLVEQGDILPNATLTGHIVFEYVGDGDYVLEFENYSDGEFYIEVPVTE